MRVTIYFRIFCVQCFVCSIPSGSVYGGNTPSVEVQQSHNIISDAKTIELYEKTATSSSDPQAIYFARLQMAKLQEKLKRPSKEIEENYELAYASCPNRAEPLYYLGAYYRSNNKFDQSVRVLSVALTIPTPERAANVERWIYDFGALFEYSISSYWLGLYKESLEACDCLLLINSLPPNYRSATERNRQWAIDMVSITK